MNPITETTVDKISVSKTHVSKGSYLANFFAVSLIVCFAISTAAGQSQTLDKVLAVVGDNIILQSDIDLQYQQAVQQSDSKLPEDFKCQLFDNLLLDKLFLSQAQLDSVVASPDEVESELDRRIKYFINVFGSREKLEEYYGKSIVELKDDFRDDIEKQLVSDKMKGKVFGTIKVTPAEVREYFESIPKDSVPYFNSELEIGQIVMFPQLTDDEKSQAKEKLTKIRNEISKGEDFSLQAILYSEDPGSASDGGNLGLIGRGELVPEFEAVAFKLNVGELSEVCETPFGYHLIMADEIRGDKRKLRHILIKPKTTSADSRIVREKMDTLLAKLQSTKLSWREAVNQFSEDESSKSVGGLMTNQKTGTTFFEKADIDGTLIFTLDRMKVGEYSEVLPYSEQDRTGMPRTGYRIVWLKSETKPHQASLETDYTKIQIAAKNEKQQKQLAQWLTLHIDKNYVKIDDSMKSCTQTKKWLRNTNR